MSTNLYIASSMIDSDHNQNIIKDNFLQPTRDGVIPQDHILTYQAYVNDLLTAARSSDPSQVILVMKNMVTVCRSITEEIENQEDVLSADTKKSLYELKTAFSNSLSDLLVAAKYHASGMGLSPVSLLDRSAGHLTSVIVELVKLLGMNSALPTLRSNLSAASSPTDNKMTTSSILSTLNDDTFGGKRLDNSSYYSTSMSNGKSNGSMSNHKSSGASSNADDMARPSVRSGLDSFTGYKSSNSNSMYSSRKYREQDDMSPNELVVSIWWVCFHATFLSLSLSFGSLEIPENWNWSYCTNHPKPTCSSQATTTKRRSAWHYQHVTKDCSYYFRALQGNMSNRTRLPIQKGVWSRAKPTRSMLATHQHDPSKIFCQRSHGYSKRKKRSRQGSVWSG